MSSDIQRFLEEINNELRFDIYRERFIEELEAHVEDGIHEYQLQGVRAEIARQETLTQLGTTEQLTSFYNYTIMSLNKPLKFLSIFFGVIGAGGIVLTFLFLVAAVGYPIVHSYTNTIYAPDFSSRAFKSVREGMTKVEVEKLVGKPLDTYKNPHTNTLTWYYAKPKRTDIVNVDYQIRWVEFDENEKVTSVEWSVNLD